MFMSIELILNAVNLTFITFAYSGSRWPDICWRSS